MSNKPANLVFIVSGPSGAGKSTLIQRLMERDPRLAFSVSHTTRPPRPGEKDGRDYYFVTKETFRKLISKGAFLEWAQVYGEYYGTSKGEIDRIHRLGKDVVLDIDVQGARQVMERLPKDQWVSIFILPPNLETLRRRLMARGKDPLDRIERRLAVAREEISRAGLYDYRVVNSDLSAATEELVGIIAWERKKRGVAAGSEL